MKFGPSRTGDPKHIRVIEKLLKEEYWPMGYYCVVDWGESGEEVRHAGKAHEIHPVWQHSPTRE